MLRDGADRTTDRQTGGRTNEHNRKTERDEPTSPDTRHGRRRTRAPARQRARTTDDCASLEETTALSGSNEREPARRRRPKSAPRRRTAPRRTMDVPTDPETDVVAAETATAICVQEIDAQCVLQFTLNHAACYALHRFTSRVIHRSELCEQRPPFGDRRRRGRRPRRRPPLDRTHGEKTRTSRATIPDRRPPLRPLSCRGRLAAVRAGGRVSFFEPRERTSCCCSRTPAPASRRAGQTC